MIFLNSGVFKVEYYSMPNSQDLEETIADTQLISSE